MDVLGQVPQQDRTVKLRVGFHGHPMVKSLHETTIEITTEEHLTERGDCIIGVGAEFGCADLDGRLKSALRQEGANVHFKILAGDLVFDMEAHGDSRLELTHPHDMVIRKSDFVSDRTLAVGASAAAKDLPREIVEILKDPLAKGFLEIEVDSP